MDKQMPGDKSMQSMKHGRHVRVLLVEDIDGDATLIQTLFRDFGSSELMVVVDRVSDGEAAMEFLHHRGAYKDAAKPQAVILDINLPKKNGFEVLLAMRKDPELRRLPVFVLTTSRAHEDILKSYSLDAISFITKPSSLSDLEELIRRFLAVELPRVLRGQNLATLDGR